MATTFIDGPAKGQRLLLRRAVTFIRVTEKGGIWDALDQPEDSPIPDETLYAYRVAHFKGMCHMNFGRGRGGFYAIIDYKFCDPQPGESIMRDATKWSEWTAKQMEEIPE